jgi:hypothetical protein
VDLGLEGVDVVREGLPFLDCGITLLTSGVESCFIAFSYISRRSAGYWLGLAVAVEEEELDDLTLFALPEGQ